MAVRFDNAELAQHLTPDAGDRDASVKRFRTAGPRKSGQELLVRLHQILAEVDKLPVLDSRSPDELVGYDESGLPT